MGKDKLRKFREIDSFGNVVQLDSGKRYKGDWANQYFKNRNPIVLELACGKGEYAVNLARMFSEKNFIGVDFKGNRLWRGAKTALEEKVKNVAFLRIRIEDILDYFGLEEVEEIWITFPDPQPQKSREKKRLTSPRFLDMYQQILRDRGLMHLKTDSAELFYYTRKQLEIRRTKVEKSTDNLYSSSFLNEELMVQTFYERKYLEARCPIYYLSWHFTKEST